MPTSSGVAPAAYSNSTVTLGSGFSVPPGVAVDAAGNVYVADLGNGAIKKIPAGLAIALIRKWCMLVVQPQFQYLMLLLNFQAVA